MSFWTKFRDFELRPYRLVLDWLTPDPPEVPQPETGVLINADGADKKIPIVYGERLIGGTRVFKGVSGTRNEFLHVVLVLCEGEIDAIGDVFIDDVVSTDPKFAGLVTLTRYTGTSNQPADVDLINNFSNWTNAHRLLGTAYLHIKLQWNKDVFRGFPKITAIVRGRKVFDPRTGQTAWSQNPALCLRDYLIDPVAGVGVDSTTVPDAQIIVAANLCEQQIQTYAGSGVFIDQFAVNGIIDTSRKVNDNVRTLLGACRGLLPFTVGEYALKVEQDEPPIFTFTEDTIIGNWNLQGTDKRSKLNRVKVRFTNPANNWQPDEAIQESATWFAEDGGLRLERDFSFDLETDPYRAQYHAEVILKKSREGIRCGFTATIEASQVAVGDVVAVTHPGPGWVNKPFRVEPLDLQPEGNVGVQLRELDPTAYDRTVPVGLPAAPDTNLPDPFTVQPPTGLSLSSGTSELLLAGDGTVISRIRVSWVAAADAFVSGYEVAFKRSTDMVWTPGPSGTGTEVFIAPVVDGIAYDVRVRASNTMGVTSPWVTVIGHSVIGKIAPPNNVTGLTATPQENGLLLSWDPVVDVDLLEYEVREGTSWSFASILDRTRSNRLLLPPVVAGTHDFLVKAIDTSGNASINAVAVSTQINGPGAPVLSSRFAGDQVVLEWTAASGDFPIAEYEVRHGATWAAATPVTRVAGTAYAAKADWINQRTWWVAGVDSAGNVGTPASLDVIVTAPSQPQVTTQVIDNNVLLRWTAVQGTLPIDLYELRRGPVYTTAEILGNVSGTFHTLFETAAGSYSYWLTAIDAAGNPSASTAVTAVVNEPPDFVFHNQFDSTFVGTRVNALVTALSGLLVPVETAQSYQGHFTTQGWASPQDQINAGSTYFMEPSLSASSYEETFDHGVVLSGTLVTLSLTTNVVTGVVVVTSTLSVSPDNITWTDYPGISQVFATNFRYVKVRLDFAASGGDDLLEIPALSVRLDVKRKRDAGAGTANAADPGGTAVSFNRPFLDVSSITVSPKGTVPLTAIYDFTDVPNPTGFSVYLFDQNGSRVSGPFSWSAEGS